jgi:GT2 family glycosyltransferase
MTSVVIVQHDHQSLTRNAVRSFMDHHDGIEYEIIVVDNGSTKDDPETLTKEFSQVQLIRLQTNTGFGVANNRGAQAARGEFLFFLNNDTITDREILTAIATEFRSDPKIGIIGPCLRYPDGRFQLSAGTLPSFSGEIIDKMVYGLLDRRVEWVEKWVEATYSAPTDTGWVTGAALCIRKTLFLGLGGFDEQFFMYFEDKDICQRVLDAGYRVRYLPQASLVHIKAGSSTADQARTGNEYRRSQTLYYRKHRPSWERGMLSVYLGLSGRRPR